MTNTRPHNLTLAAIFAANNATAASRSILTPDAPISTAAFAKIITATEPAPPAIASQSAAPAAAVNCPLSTVNSAAPAANSPLSTLHSQLTPETAAQLSPADFFRTFLPHHCRHDFNPMHHYSFEQYTRQHAQPLPHRTGRRLAIAAPRGAAKSTVHTLLFPLMDLVQGRERHQVIISGTHTQAKNRLATIATELRNNQLIRDVFFGGKVPKYRVTCTRIEINGCCIEAFSANSEMRGITHGEYRPTRIILDDVEQSRNATKAYHRTKLLNWYDEVVENLGDNYTHITIVGTILHTDSLLSTLLNRPGYKGKLYKSIVQWDNRPDLWRAWQRLFTDKSDPDAVETAEAFYRENFHAMTRGVEVFWEAKEPYVKLQEKLLVNGRAAFFKEKQNEPIRSGDYLFDTSQWGRFISPDGYIELVPAGLTLEQEEEARQAMINSIQSATTATGSPAAVKTVSARKADLKYYGFLDPALGKSTSRDGDYAAIVTVGKAPDNTLYVENVWMEKVSPMKQIEQVFALHHRYRYEKFGFESNGFQETLGNFIKAEQEKLKKAGNHWNLPIEKVNNSHNKHSRIMLLEPHIMAGSILFQADLPQNFYAQADEYTGSRSQHDDGLDALASCVEMIRAMDPAPVAKIKSVKGQPLRTGF